MLSPDSFGRRRCRFRLPVRAPFAVVFDHFGVPHPCGVISPRRFVFLLVKPQAGGISVLLSPVLRHPFAGIGRELPALRGDEHQKSYRPGDGVPR